MYIDTTSGIGTRTEYAPNRIPVAVFRIIHIQHTAAMTLSFPTPDLQPGVVLQSLDRVHR